MMEIFLAVLFAALFCALVIYGYVELVSASRSRTVGILYVMACFIVPVVGLLVRFNG